MFDWLTKNTPEAAAEQEFSLAQIHGADVAVLFKHSPSCAVSWAARSEVTAFAEAHPTVPVHTISVRNRELARQIAAETKVRHESPQVIVFRRGQVVAHTSHEGVTAEYLTEAISKPTAG